MKRATHSEKRRRSRVARILVWAAGVVVVLFAIASWWVYSVMYAEPNPRVDYAAKIVDLCESRQPPGENGWEEFADAIAIFGEVANDIFEKGMTKAEAKAAELGRELSTAEDWEYTRDYSRIYHGSSDPMRWRLEREELHRLRERGAFAKLEEALAHPNIVSPPFEPDEEFGMGLIGSLLPIQHLSDVREFAQAITCRMRLAMLDGDPDEHRRMFRSAIGLSRVIGVQPAQVYYLTATSSMHYPLAELRYEIMERQFTVDECRELWHIIDDETQWLNRFDAVVESERYFVHSAIQQWYTENIFGNGRVILTRLPDASSSFGYTSLSAPGEPTLEDRLMNFKAYTMPSRWDTEDAADRYFDFVADFSRKTLHEQVRTVSQIETLGKSVSSENEIAARVLPRFDRLHDARAQMIVQRDATKAMLVLEVHEAMHGEPPAFLDQLDEELKPLLPPDPIQPDGAPFAYIRFDQPDGDGRDYLLYSIGLDGEDNEGAMLPGGDSWKQWRPRWPIVGAPEGESHQGYDYLLNDPRPDYDEP